MQQKTKPYIALALVCLIWGTTYLVNKIGVSHAPAFLFSGVRQLIAGSLLFAYIFLIKKCSFPEKSYFKFHSILAILLIFVGNGIGTYGLQFIDSGISAVIAALSPIIIAILSIYINPEDKLRPFGWLGIILGTIGLFLICYEHIQDDHQKTNTLLGIVCTVASVSFWAIGTVISKTKKFKEPPLMASSIHMLIGGLPMILMSFVFEKPMEFTVTMNTIYIWAYLIIFGSIVAYSCYIYALKYLPATLVSIQSYINPILALILGSIILKEKLTPILLIGTMITLVGIILVNFSMYKKRKLDKENL